jgi:hypothetical protein
VVSRCPGLLGEKPETLAALGEAEEPLPRTVSRATCAAVPRSRVPNLLRCASLVRATAAADYRVFRPSCADVSSLRILGAVTVTRCA